jgi:hypothetical protein
MFEGMFEIGPAMTIQRLIGTGRECLHGWNGSIGMRNF